MREIESPHGAADGRPVSKGARWHVSRRSVVRATAIALLVILIPIVVNQITPRPLAFVLRAGVGMIEDSVNMGPYADRVERITTSDAIRVTVEDQPTAHLTLYSDGEQTPPKPVILLIHGGGWILGAASQVATYAKLLASEGYLVANLEYSLAPEHEYPTAILQSVAALDYLHANSARFGGDPTRLFVGGNSAGAQLAAQVGAIVTNPVLRQEMGVSVDVSVSDLRGVILYSGPYDFHTVDRTDFPAFDTFAWSYLGRKDWSTDPRLDQMSTALTATPDYPPTYLTAGDADPLEPQTYELDAKLRAKGVDVTSRYWTGTGSDLPHDYIFDLSTSAAQKAFVDTVKFLNDHSE